MSAVSEPNTSTDAGPPMPVGTGGAIGGTGGVSSAPKPSFGAHLEGSDVILDTNGRAWFAAACGEPLAVDKRDGGAWIPLRDDRPQPSNEHHIDDYFLDGEYVAPRDFDCDVPLCTFIGPKVRAGSALEFVKIGHRARRSNESIPPRDANGRARESHAILRAPPPENSRSDDYAGGIWRQMAVNEETKSR